MMWERTTISLLGWEFQRAFRRPGPFLSRAIYALLLLVVMSLAFASMVFRFGDSHYAELRIYPHFAITFFHFFCFCQMAGGLLFSIILVAPSIAAEREKHTLDELFCTQIGIGEWAFSKWLSCFLTVSATLFAGVPIIAISVALFGGFNFDQLLMSTLGVGATAISTSSIAISISARSRSVVRSTLTAAGTAILLWSVTPILCAGLFEVYRLISAYDPLAMNEDFIRPALSGFHPLRFLSAVLEDFNDGTYSQLWCKTIAYVSIHVLLGSLIFVRTIRFLNRMREAGSLNLSAAGAFVPDSADRKPRNRANDFPIYWRERVQLWKHPVKTVLIWLFITFICLYPIVASKIGWPTMRWQPNPQRNFLRHVQFCGSGLFLFTMLIIALRSAGSIAREKTQLTWDSLRIAQLGSREIIRQKTAAAMSPAFVLLSVMAPVWLLATFFGSMSMQSLCAVFVVVLISSYLAACLGVYFSSTYSKASTAIFGTLLSYLFIFGAGHWIALNFVLFGQVYFWNGLSGALFFLSCPTMIYFQSQFAPDQQMMVLPLKADPREGLVVAVIYLTLVLYFSHGLYRGAVRKLESDFK